MPFQTQGTCVKKDDNDNIYVFGGRNNYSSQSVNYLQISDTKTNTWSSIDEGIPNIPNTNGIADAPCAYFNGIMYLFGGYNAFSTIYNIHKLF